MVPTLANIWTSTSVLTLMLLAALAGPARAQPGSSEQESQQQSRFVDSLGGPYAGPPRRPMSSASARRWRWPVDLPGAAHSP